MKDDTILEFTDPAPARQVIDFNHREAGISPDPLTDILRKGAEYLLAQAVAPVWVRPPPPTPHSPGKTHLLCLCGRPIGQRFPP